MDSAFRFKLTFLVAFGLVHLPTWAATTTVTKTTFQIDSGTTAFTAVGKPAMIRIKGEGPGATGSFEIREGKIFGHAILDLTSLKTGIDLRDEHMKTKYLQTDRYPKAELELSELDAQLRGAQELKDLNDAPFTGKLSIHGVTKDVSGKFNLSGTKGAATVDAKFSVILSDFKIDIPSYMGITVSDHVDVEVNLKLSKR